MKKNIWFVILIIIILAGAGIWFFGSKNSVIKKEQPAEQETEETAESQEIVILASTSTISEMNNFYSIKANYPQFTEIDPAFNKKIADLIAKKIDIFKNDVKENWDARNETLLPGEEIMEYPPELFDFVSDWKQVQLNGKYINFVITMHYYTGGAHGMDEVFAFNYDLTQKKEITIEDFLGSSAASLQKLSDLAQEEVISLLQEAAGGVDSSMKAWIKTGAGPEWDNFKDFNFNQESLIIYFQRYQVAAGAFGPITAALSKEALEQNSISTDYWQE